MSGADHWFYRPFRAVHAFHFEMDDMVVASLRVMAAEAHPMETGGLILGWWDGEVPHVIDVVEVTDPKAGHSRWQRDESAAASVLAKSIAASEIPDIGYIGDWHSHPVNIGPSSSDIAELRRISRQYSHALLIAVVRHGGAIDIRIALRGSLTTPQRLEGYRRPISLPTTR